MYHIERSSIQSKNAALAVLAAAGDHAALGQLWENNRGLLHLIFSRWYTQNNKIALAHGLTLEDLEQEGFFAVQYAAQQYDPHKGYFSTNLKFAVQKQLHQILLEGHYRFILTKDNKKVKASSNPLNYCLSLDQPYYNNTDDSTLANIVSDASVTTDLTAVEESIDVEFLRSAIKKALILSKLTPRELKVIQGICLGQTLVSLAAAEGVSRTRIKQIRNSAFRKIRKHIQHQTAK